MTILILIAALLAVFHFLMESTILPSVRIDLRYKFFEQRDKLRRLLIEEKITEGEFNLMDKKINTSIHHLADLTISLVIRVNKFISANKKVKAVLVKHHEDLTKSKCKELRDIADECNKLSLVAFGINAFGWLPYLLAIFPIVLLVVFAIIGIRKAKSNILQVFYLPEQDVEDMMERSIYATAN